MALSTLTNTGYLNITRPIGPPPAINTRLGHRLKYEQR